MIEVKQGDTREWIRARLTIVTGGVAVPCAEYVFDRLRASVVHRTASNI